MIYWTAFVVGIVGSFHCIGMCGPIALVLPLTEGNTARLILGRILYNAGRILTYSVIGGVIGFAGQGLSLAGFQQWVSIITGILIILFLIIPNKLSARVSSFGPVNQFNQFIRLRLGILFKKKSDSSLLLIGILNGFLPCGLVYVALAGALTTGHFTGGILYMAAFGLGTFPVMLAVSLFGQFVNIRVRQKINRIIPAFVFILAVLFILRGMNLGIKYISPRLQNTTATEQKMDCH